MATDKNGDNNNNNNYYNDTGVDGELMIKLD